MSTRKVKVNVTVAQAIRLAGMRVAVQAKIYETEHLSITDNITGDDVKIFVVGPEETVRVPAKLDLLGIAEIPWFGTMSKRAPSRIYGFFEIKFVLGSPVATYYSYGDVEKENPPLNQILENLEKLEIPVPIYQFSETVRREYPLIN